MGVRHMRGKRALTAGMTLLGLVALLVAPTAVMGAKPTTELDPSLCAPGENTFSLVIDNSFFPLAVGQQWVLQGKEQGQTIGLRITVLVETETLFSGRRAVTTRVIEELEWEDAHANGLVDSVRT
jgi:hypothetical protein